MTTEVAPAGIAIVGPTASGKTALSIEVAALLDGEIISMDSRQVYRGMDIGTAKATPAQRASVPHHGLDLADPSERFSAGRFARFARRCIEQIRDRGRVPILVGGTGFFLRALTDPIFREPDLDPARRDSLQAYLERLSQDQQRAWLAALDPQTADRLGRGGGKQRVLRELEMALLTGQPISWWHRHAPPEAAPLELRIYVLDPPSADLFRAIDARVDRMLREGLLDEVRALQQRGYSPGDPGMNATGYAELFPVLAGEVSLETAAELIRKNTRAYARRQLTWLRHQLPPNAVWMDPAERLPGQAERIAGNWRATMATIDDAAAPRRDRRTPLKQRDSE